jgi:hypothetical protein
LCRERVAATVAQHLLFYIVDGYLRRLNISKGKS